MSEKVLSRDAAIPVPLIERAYLAGRTNPCSSKRFTETELYLVDVIIDCDLQKRRFPPGEVPVDVVESIVAMIRQHIRWGGAPAKSQVRWGGFHAKSAARLLKEQGVNI